MRDYQPGDALSRVHWAQTAKRGRLQTKELRAPAGLRPHRRGAARRRRAARAPTSRPPSRRPPPSAATWRSGASPSRWRPRAACPPRLPRAGGLARDGARARPGRRPAATAPSGSRCAPSWRRPTRPTCVIVVTGAARAGDPARAVGQGRALGAGVAAVLVGPAAASSAELAGGAAPTWRWSPAADRVAAALSRTRMAVAGVALATAARWSAAALAARRARHRLGGPLRGPGVRAASSRWPCSRCCPPSRARPPRARGPRRWPARSSWPPSPPRRSPPARRRSR